ncbi:MAG: cysteine--tRNA ligase [Candidatus Limiplasma sp.]|nr:cysteine--tRNA ligase [Candidatus Limiplasma sp.]
MEIFNSMTRKKEPFVPIREGKVGIYACGPTVYNYFHIGNARPFIIFDVLRRYLEHRGYEVTFVQNFTDIDDRMIQQARQDGTTVQAVAERFIKEYEIDARALGIRPATVHPRATEHIPQIIAMIRKLMDKGLAYESNGDVYYRVKAFPSYGCLCGQNLGDLDCGARVSVDEQKEDPLDFALWKAQKPGEPAWESPWGLGRPGWHIECSAMSTTYLGEHFDIHGGGKDLLFPHHENEIAQTSGATGQPYVNYWMHNGFINIDNEKMSKSKGNFFTVRDIGKEYDLQAVRMFMLSAHYRSPINFGREMIQQAASSLERLSIAKDQLAFLMASAQEREPDEGEAAFMAACDQARAHFYDAMDDDLNTADALSAIFDLARDIHKLPLTPASRKAIAYGQETFSALTGVLGLLEGREEEISPEVQAMVQERAQARKDKNWKRSDELRDAIKALGYILEDTPAGQKVRKGQ